MLAGFEREAREKGGALIVDVGGCVGWTFSPVKLRKMKPELFESLESVEARLEDLEESQGTNQIVQQRLANAVAQITRDVAKVHARRMSQ